MRDYLTLGTAPTGEPCVQIGDENYRQKLIEESFRYRDVLLAKFGTPPGNSHYALKSFAHDFGTYHEVCIVFDNDDEEETDFAYSVENNLPEYWEE